MHMYNSPFSFPVEFCFNGFTGLSRLFSRRALISPLWELSTEMDSPAHGFSLATLSQWAIIICLFYIFLVVFATLSHQVILLQGLIFTVVFATPDHEPR